MRAARAPVLLRALVAPALLLALVWLGLAAVHAQDPLPVPALTARVIDQTDTLSAEQRSALESKLATFEAEAGPQIVVLLVPSTQPEDIAAYAQRVADTWKIGRREVGDGLLIVVAKNERRVRIEVAKALEGAIPDLAARQIIDGAIRPAFRANDYAGGLNAALDQLIARVRGEGLPAPSTTARDGARDGPQLDELALFFFVAVVFAGTALTRMFGRKFGSMLTAGVAGGLGWWLTASLLIGFGAAVVALLLVGILGFGSAMRRVAGARHLPHIGGLGGLGGGLGGGWGGGGGGWGGGGGFGSGGGGDFGGGGASGDW